MSGRARPGKGPRQIQHWKGKPAKRLNKAPGGGKPPSGKRQAPRRGR